MKMFLASALMVLGLATSAKAQNVVIRMAPGSGSASISVNQNGMVITFNGNRMYRRRISMDAPGSLTIGSKVVTSGNLSGTIAAMNPTTQTVSVNIPYNGMYTFTLDQLAVTDGCNGVFCVGENVVTSTNLSGKVVGLFGNGSAAVEIPYNGTYTFAATSLGLTDACSGYFCTGDAVVTDSNLNGKVKGIFADESLSVDIPYNGVYTYQVSQLSITQAICANIYIDRVGVCR